MVTAQSELQVQAKLAELSRVQRAVDETGWMAPAAVLACRHRPRLRQKLGLAMIRLGAAMAGPAAPSLVPRAAPSRL